MSGAQHTPGPWRLEAPMGPDTFMVVAGGPSLDEWACIATMSSDDEYDPPRPAMEANARLIAAAPEMYEALRALHLEAVWLARQLAVKGIPGRPGDSVDRALEGARAAVANAEGQS